MKFQNAVVTRRSMPFWCVANPLGDPFGGAVLEKSDSLDTAGIIADAAREGLIEATSYHDDDLVPWNPEEPEDDLDPSSFTWRRLHEIKEILDDAGLAVNSSICSLHGNKLFRNGGLCNPDPEIRRLARLKVERTLRIGQFFGAEYYVYWVARDGFEVPVCTDWKHVYQWLADGLNHVTDYMRERGMDNYIGATIEPKPNEPRGQMFLPTSGHAAGLNGEVHRALLPGPTGGPPLYRNGILQYDIPVYSNFPPKAREEERHMLDKLIEIILPEIISVLELMGIAVVTVSALGAFWRYLRSLVTRTPCDVKFALANGLALSLELKMAAEILKTVLVRELQELLVLGAVILLRALLSFLIHFEMKDHAVHAAGEARR